MNTKLKIKLYFLTKNYDALKDLVVDNEETIKLFNKKEIENLLNFSLVKKEIILPLAILNDLILNNTQEFSEKEIIDYLNTFLPIVLANTVLLYNFANILSTNPKKYTDIISKIKEHNLNNELTEITIYILSLDGFYDMNLENRVIKSQNTHFIFELIRDANSLKTSNILSKYLKTLPTPFDIYRLSKNLLSYNDKLEILINAILELNIDNSIKSRYLLATFTGTNKILLKDKIINSIINLNSLLVVFDLMQLLTDEEQNKIASNNLELNNPNIIFTLACTTNCEKTKDLIDYIFPKLDFYNLTILLSYVNEKYINYILNKIIIERKELYLRILNELYLIGSNRYETMILFIITNKLENLFDSGIIKIIKKWQDSSKNEYEKKRILT